MRLPSTSVAVWQVYCKTFRLTSVN